MTRHATAPATAAATIAIASFSTIHATKPTHTINITQICVWGSNCI